MTYNNNSRFGLIFGSTAIPAAILAARRAFLAVSATVGFLLRSFDFLASSTFLSLFGSKL